MAAKLALSGPTTPPLALLDPVRSPALSRNLHSWLREYGGRVGLDLVYRVRDGSQLAQTYGPGELLIGSPYLDAPDSEDFSGARLSMVLTDGDKVRRSCYPGALPQLELLPTFWDAYLRIGRCAYDPAHQVHFSGADRFTVDGNKRTCLWCGAVQYKKRVERVVVEETWGKGEALMDAVPEVPHG